MHFNNNTALINVHIAHQKLGPLFRILIISNLHNILINNSI